jgi:hypothetical protein
VNDRSIQVGPPTSKDPKYPKPSTTSEIIVVDDFVRPFISGSNCCRRLFRSVLHQHSSIPSEKHFVHTHDARKLLSGTKRRSHHDPRKKVQFWSVARRRRRRRRPSQSRHCALRHARPTKRTHARSMRGVAKSGEEWLDPFVATYFFRF